MISYTAFRVWKRCWHLVHSSYGVAFLILIDPTTNIHHNRRHTLESGALASSVGLEVETLADASSRDGDKPFTTCVNLHQQTLSCGADVASTTFVLLTNGKHGRDAGHGRKWEEEEVSAVNMVFLCVESGCETILNHLPSALMSGSSVHVSHC